MFVCRTATPQHTHTLYRSPDMLLHGEAVAIDMALSTELAYGRGLLTSDQRLRVLKLLATLKLPLWHETCSVDLLMKVRGGGTGRMHWFTNDV